MKIQRSFGFAENLYVFSKTNFNNRHTAVDMAVIFKQSEKETWPIKVYVHTK